MKTTLLLRLPSEVKTFEVDTKEASKLMSARYVMRMLVKKKPDIKISITPRGVVEVDART